MSNQTNFIPLVSLLLTDKILKISAYSGHGMMREDPDVTPIFLTTQYEPTQLGIVIVNLLLESRFIEAADLPLFRKRFEEHQKTANTKIAETYGYRRESDIYTKAASCNVEGDNNLIIFQPLHHKRGDHWEPTYRGEADHVVIPSDSTPEEIGKAAWLALSRCTGRRPDILDSINLDGLNR